MSRAPRALRAHRVPYALALLGLAAGAAGAQVRSSLRVGAGAMPVRAQGSSPVLAEGAVRWDGVSFALGAAARTEPTLDAVSRAHGWVGGSARTAPLARWLGDWRVAVDATASATRFSGGRRAGRVGVAAGPELVARAFDASARIGIDRLDNGTAHDEARTLGLTLRRQLGRTALTLQGARTAFRGEVPGLRDTTFLVAGFSFAGTVPGTRPGALSYADAQASVDLLLGLVGVSARLGARTGGPDDGDPRRWAGVLAALPLSARVGVVAEVGRWPGTPELGLPAWRAATLALRFSPARRTDPPIGPLRPRTAQQSSGVDADARGVRTLRVDGVIAERVEVMGDLTDWAPRELARDESQARRWRLDVPLAAGLYRLVMRVNGGAWHPPPGLPATADEFSGTVGVLRVP